QLLGDNIWCEVLQRQPNGRFVVRLRHRSIFSGPATRGALFVAGWDGATFHRPSGRPMLFPIRRLNARSAGLPGNIKVRLDKKHVQKGPQDEDVVLDARYLGSRLAIVYSAVPGLAVRPNDVVRLGNDPGERDGMPEVTDIVYQPNPQYS